MSRKQAASVIHLVTTEGFDERNTKCCQKLSLSLILNKYQIEKKCQASLLIEE